MENTRLLQLMAEIKRFYLHFRMPETDCIEKKTSEGAVRFIGCEDD
jgi:hypothetical protein